MYLKLMVRGLQRHRKKGRRLFVLMALCSATLIFLLTFRNDFRRQNTEQFIGLQTGHIQIVPHDSPLLAQSFTMTEREDVPLLGLGDDFDEWLHGLPEIEEAAPVITRYGIAYNLDSERESWVSLIAVDAKRRDRLFPVASVTSGDGNIEWSKGMEDVPILRSRLQNEWGEKNSDPSRFVKSELNLSDDGLPSFMARVSSDFPQYFASGPYADAGDLDRFLGDMNKAIADGAMHDRLPAKFLEEYDWKIDDAVTAARENADPSMTGFLNKRIFKALYFEDIAYLPEPIVPGKRVSLQLSPFKTTGATELPTVIPAVYSGMCEINPLYVPNSFVDIGAFRTFMDLGENDATAWVVRLKDIRDTASVKEKIEAHLAETGSDAKVIDYNFLGEIYLTTGVAFSLIIGILVAIFVVILLIFTINLVLMSMIQRRKEIGTGLALGLDNMQTIVVMTGEVAVIVAVSCAGGSALGFLMVLAAMHFGIPGMIFFAGAKLYPTLQAMPFILTWAIILPSSIIVSFIPLLRMRGLMPVDLFREER